MPLDFPNSPTPGQIFTSTGVSWVWNGTTWTMGSGAGFLPLTGGTLSGPGNLTVNGAMAVSGAGIKYGAADTFAFVWTGSVTNLWVNGTNTGPLAVGNFLPLSGGTTSGNITIAPASGWAALALSASTGNRNQVLGYIGGKARWEIDLGNAAAESTGNAGSDFGIARYNDAGVGIDYPLTIVRATGTVTVTGPLTLTSGTNTTINFINTVPSNTAGGLWRATVGAGGNWNLQSNTAVAGDFSTSQQAVQTTPLGAVAIGTAGMPSDAVVGTLMSAYLVTSGASALYNNVYNATGGGKLLTNAAATAFNMGSGVFYFYNAPAAAAGSVPAWKQLAFLDGNGNLSTTGAIVSGSGVTLGQGGDLFLSRTDNPAGWIIRPNTAGLKNLNLATTGGNTLDTVSIIAATTITSGNIVIPNQTWFQGKDTAGNGANLLTMWSDNNCYLSEASRPLHCRGSTISMEGATTFNTRATFSDGFNLYGGTFYNGYSNGWLYFNGSLRVVNFYSENDVNCAGSLIVNGMYWQNNGGWMYSPNAVLSNGDVAAQGVLRAGGTGGPYWQNSGGWMYTPQNLLTGGVIAVSGNTGVFWQYNSGCMYTPNNLIVAGGVVYYSSDTSYYIQAYAGYLYTPKVVLNNGILPNSNNAVSDGLTGNAYGQVAAYWFNNPSSRVEKTDIATLPNGALDKVMALSPRVFHWKEVTDPDGVPVSPQVVRIRAKLHSGFVADEVAATLGEDFGGYDRDEEGREGISYNELTAVLWKACQELSASNMALAARVEALEARYGT
jgi:hypothetical protein